MDLLESVGDSIGGARREGRGARGVERVRGMKPLPFMAVVLIETGESRIPAISGRSTARQVFTDQANIACTVYGGGGL